MAIIVILIIIGILLILSELLLLPGLGLSGFFGLGALGGAAYYSFILYGFNTACWISLLIAIIVISFILMALNSEVWKKVSLNTNIESKTNDLINKLQVGQRGIAVSRLAPIGRAKFVIEEETVFIEVSCLNDIINQGQEIYISHIDKSKIFVKSI